MSEARTKQKFRPLFVYIFRGWKRLALYKRRKIYYTDSIEIFP